MGPALQGAAFYGADRAVRPYEWQRFALTRRRDTRVPPYRARRFTGRTEPSAPTNGSADVLTRRRDTRVPPYRVQRFYGAGRVVRPYLLYKEKELPEGSSF